MTRSRIGNPLVSEGGHDRALNRAIRPRRRAANSAIPAIPAVPAVASPGHGHFTPHPRHSHGVWLRVVVPLSFRATPLVRARGVARMVTICAAPSGRRGSVSVGTRIR
jgi:hypothetical protein